MAVLVIINAIEELAAIDLGEFDMDDGDAWDHIYNMNSELYDLFGSDDIYELCETMEDFRALYPTVEIMSEIEELKAFMNPSDMAITEE